MKQIDRIPLWGKITLTLIVILLMDFQPLPNKMTDELEAAWNAWQSGSALSVAFHLETAAEQHTQRADLLRIAGLYALDGGDPLSAIRLFDSFSPDECANPICMTAIGDAYQNLGIMEEAMGYWSTALAWCDEFVTDQVPGTPISMLFAFPTNLLPMPEIWETLTAAHISQRLGRAYFDLNDHDAAEGYLKTWLDFKPGDVEAQYLMGLMLAVRRPEASLHHFSLVLTTDNEYEIPARHLHNAIDSSLLESQPAYTFVVVGRELGKLQEWVLAEMAFSEATIVDPSYADAWAFLGEARQQTGGDGLPELQAASELDQGSIAVNTLLSLYWRRQEQYDLAIEYLQGAIKSNEGNPTLIAELGNLYAEAGNLPEAQTLYQQAVELAPWDPTYWKLLAELSFMSQANIRDLGLPAARQSLNLDRNDPDAMDLLGRMLMLLGDNITAERFFRKALFFDPGFVAARLHLGQVLLNQGDLDMAQIQLELTIHLGSGSSESEHAQRLLQTYFP